MAQELKKGTERRKKKISGQGKGESSEPLWMYWWMQTGECGWVMSANGEALHEQKIYHQTSVKCESPDRRLSLDGT